MDDFKSTWGYFVAALVMISLTVQKVLNMRKADQTEGTVLTRVDSLEKRAARHDRQIHKYAVTQTRLIVVVTHQNAIIMDNGFAVPTWLQNEIDDLTKGDTAEESDAEEVIKPPRKKP